MLLEKALRCYLEIHILCYLSYVVMQDIMSRSCHEKAFSRRIAFHFMLEEKPHRFSQLMKNCAERDFNFKNR